jgi:folate-binding protein YgfZ
MPERTPLHQQAEQAGAVFAEEAGWLVPAQFGDPGGEYASACESADLFDVSHRGKVELSGADAVSFLHNLCTNDIKNLAPNTGCEAFLTTAKAKVVAYLLVGRLHHDGQTLLWLDLAPGMAATVHSHLDHYLISEQVQLSDRTREFAQVYLCGPQARAIVARAVGGPLPEQTFQMRPREGGGFLRRNDLLGLPGYDVVCPGGEAAALWQALTAAGARPAGGDVLNILRVEAGTPAQGPDIDEGRLAVEVGRGTRSICYTKGCFLGQEPIVMARDRGHVNRTLLGLRLHVAEPAEHGARVFRDGAEVGVVTSSVWSPRLRAAIALAYLRRGHQEPGTKVEVETGGRRCGAEVAALPFVGTA